MRIRQSMRLVSEATPGRLSLWKLQSKAMFTRDRFQMVPIQKSCRIGLLFTRDLLTVPSTRSRSGPKTGPPKKQVQVLEPFRSQTDPSPCKHLDRFLLADPSPCKHPDRFLLVDPSPCKHLDRFLLVDPSPCKHSDRFLLADPSPCKHPDRFLLVDPSSCKHLDRFLLAGPSPCKHLDRFLLVLRRHFESYNVYSAHA